MVELDPQAEAFLDDLESRIAPPTSGLAVETGRRLLDDLFAVDEPEEVAEIRDFGIPGPGGDIPVRIYVPAGTPPFPVLTYFHGGGWVRGSLDAYDGLCRMLANDAGCMVVSVGYRRAPEHPFPAALEDCYAAALWTETYAEDINADPSRLAVGGDSAGGNLTAAVTLMSRDQGAPNVDHQTLIYPAVNPPSLRWFDSYDENAEGYLLEMESIEWYYDQYVARTDIRNPYAFPLQSRDLSGLPPATVLTAGFDPLRDEGIAYAERLEADGVPVEHRHYEGQIHGFVSLFEFMDAGGEAVETLAGDIADGLVVSE